MVEESKRAEDGLIADGVDEEPIEGNRRLLTGWRMQAVAGFAALYALFHMAALNGVSISAYTGITVPLLPQFPMETWNFRIVHIAGALALGFVIYNAAMFSDKDETADGGIWGKIAYVLFLPALLALGTSLWFAQTIASGSLPEMGGLTTWPAFAGTPIYSQEVWYFGIPLLIATGGGIVLGWLEKAPRDRFRVSDILLAVCGVAVAAYLVAIYGTAARNSVGTPFVPIGVAFAATAGSAMILELTRRVAGLALVIITGVFLVYTFVAHLLPGIL
ncbi:MAG: TRAP transporter permease, partial [Marivita sp.]|nr:TRAP transporter permease [Marivita sp.]